MALAGGSFLFVGIVVLILLGVPYGFYTRSGSGIETRPHDGTDGAPGAAGPGEVSGRDEGQGSAFDTHGTR